MRGVSVSNDELAASVVYNYDVPIFSCKPCSRLSLSLQLRITYRKRDRKGEVTHADDIVKVLSQYVAHPYTHTYIHSPEPI
jgi:hypothetical protein